MTDERLDQILKQALAPEIADTETAVKQAGRNYYMKKLWKIGVAAVACAQMTNGFLETLTAPGSFCTV